MKDVYKLYNFKFYKDKAIEGLRLALKEKGFDNKHKFVDFVLKYYPDKSKSTLEEYYTRRLCNDNDILKLLHDELKINLQEALLPNGYCESKFVINGICDPFTFRMDIMNYLDMVLYNSDKLNKNSSLEEFNDYYDSLETLIHIYSYYNYLIQKYMNSYLSEREREILDLFVKVPLTNPNSIYQFIDDNKGKNDIFNLYYQKNTLCLLNEKKHYLLDYIKMFDIVSEDKLLDLLCIIPPKEKNVLYTIYKKMNNVKMAKALSNFNVTEMEKIEIVNNSVTDTLNILIDKGVL